MKIRINVDQEIPIVQNSKSRIYIQLAIIERNGDLIVTQGNYKLTKSSENHGFDKVPIKLFTIKVFFAVACLRSNCLEETNCKTKRDSPVRYIRKRVARFASREWGEIMK